MPFASLYVLDLCKKKMKGLFRNKCLNKNICNKMYQLNQLKKN